MIVQKIDLYKHFSLPRPYGNGGYLDIYVHDNKEYAYNNLRPAMLVIPGGGYEWVSLREKEPIVFEYLTEGFNCFALTYSINEQSKYPNPLLEAVMAMLYIKQTAEQYHTNPEKVCGIGFSAGGHLLGLLVTAYANKEIREIFGEECLHAKLNGAIFSYPVILTENTHAGSIQNITGGDKNLLSVVDISKNINKDSTPAFIWTTVDDELVPSESSLELALAYKRAGVPFELHMFKEGEHGLSTAKEEVETINPAVQPWIRLSHTWLKLMGFVTKKFNQK